MTDLSLTLAKQALDASNDGILVTDYCAEDNPIIYANKAFLDLTGYSLEELLGRNCRFLQGTDRDQPGLAVVRQAILDGKPCKVRLRNYRKSGELFWNELSLAPIRNEQQRVTHFIGIQKDITLEVNYQERILELSQQDPLTGILNKRGFQVQALKLMELAQRAEQVFGIAFIDIDNFKHINDFYGHPTGDAVLKACAESLHQHFRKTDVVARWGGDEFVIAFLYKQPTHQWLGGRMHHALGEINKKLKLPELISFSYGFVYSYQDKTINLAKLIEAADMAMYSMKQSKK